MALTEFAKQWGAVFNKATQVFTKDIGTATKSEKSLGAGLKHILEDAQNPTAVLGSLVAIDKIDLGTGSPKELAALPANIKLFKPALKTFDANKKKYIKDLDEALKSKPTLLVNLHKIPTDMKQAYPETFRQLKILKTEIEAIYAVAAQHLSKAETLGKTQKIIAEKDKAKDKIKGGGEEANAKIKLLQNEASMKQLLVGFGAKFKSGMAKGAAVIQKIKSSPDLATYNKEMTDGGRDISQNVNNIAKLKADPKFSKTSLAKKLPTPPDSMIQELTAFGNGAKRNLPNTASVQDVKQALAEFTALYKQVATMYAAVIAGKVG